MTHALTPTSKLKAGDLVSFYGATYRLTEDARQVPHHLDSPVYVADSELVRGSAQLSCATWRFQGNDYASWAVLTD